MRSVNAITPCPLCHQDVPLAFRTRDVNRRISSTVFDYYRCPACGLIFLSPIPTNLGGYYLDDYYILPPSIHRLDQIAETQRYQIEMVRQFVPTGRLLEIGPGYGSFAHLAKKVGFDVQTIEMDEQCCRYLTEVVRVRAINSRYPEAVLRTVESQHVIALWQVLEHLPEPFACLRQAAEALMPGGILLIATPNPSAFQFRLLGRRWPHVDAPRHLHLVPVKLLIEQLAGSGLKPVMVTSNDPGGKGWNIFGWQKALMNVFPARWLRLPMLGVGWIIGRVAAVFESRELRGSAYTIILQKVDAA